MRAKLVLLTFALFVPAVPLRADVTYDLTLTAFNPSASGGGTLVINTPPSTTGYDEYLTDAYPAG